MEPWQLLILSRSEKDTDHSLHSSPPTNPSHPRPANSPKDVPQTPFPLKNGASLTREMRFYLANQPSLCFSPCLANRPSFCLSGLEDSFSSKPAVHFSFRFTRLFNVRDRPPERRSLPTRTRKPFFAKKIGSAASNVAQVFCAHQTIYQFLSTLHSCVMTVHRQTFFPCVNHSQFLKNK